MHGQFEDLYSTEHSFKGSRKMTREAGEENMGQILKSLGSQAEEIRLHPEITQGFQPEEAPD